jgi:hypothetical protein
MQRQRQQQYSRQQAVSMAATGLCGAPLLVCGGIVLVHGVCTSGAAGRGIVNSVHYRLLKLKAKKQKKEE